MSIRVIIGSSSEKVSRQLAHFLSENGFHVVGETTDGYDFLRRVHTVYPDVSIVDYQLKGINGYELSETLISERVCPVVALISAAELQYFVNLNQEPTFMTLVKPINRFTLINTLQVLVKASKSLLKLEEEVKNLKNTQDSKTVIDKAKKLLMIHKQLTEEEAHRYIQKLSMDKGIAKIKVAESIIMTYN